MKIAIWFGIIVAIIVVGWRTTNYLFFEAVIDDKMYVYDLSWSYEVKEIDPYEDCGLKYDSLHGEYRYKCTREIRTVNSWERNGKYPDNPRYPETPQAQGDHYLRYDATHLIIMDYNEVRYKRYTNRDIYLTFKLEQVYQCAVNRAGQLMTMKSIK